MQQWSQIFAQESFRQILDPLAFEPEPNLALDVSLLQCKINLV